jgi:hypothetical protein
VRLAPRTPSGHRLSGRIVGEIVATGPDTLTVRSGEREVVVKARGALAPGERWRREQAGPALRPQRRGLGAELALSF